MEIRHATVVFAHPYTSEQKASFSTVKWVLKKNSIAAVFVERCAITPQHMKNKDIIIAVGGDGTFLRAAQFISNATPIFGVNAEPKTKEGFYMRSTGRDFAEKLHLILHGNYRIRKLARLQALINGRKISELALNEFYFGAAKPYQTARYIIKFGNKKEPQRSSGIIIATPTGSGAWVKAAGGMVLDESAAQFTFYVREPFERKVYANYKLKKGVLKKNQSLQLTSHMECGCLVADSVSREYLLQYDDTVTIKLSKNPVHCLEV